MRETGGRFGFGFEPFDQILAGERPGADELQGNEPVQADLARFKHDAHSAAGDFFQQFVIAEVTQFRARKRRQRRGGWRRRFLSNRSRRLRQRRLSALCIQS